MTKSRIALSKINRSFPLHDKARPFAEANKQRLALSQEEHPRGTRDRISGRTRYRSAFVRQRRIFTFLRDFSRLRRDPAAPGSGVVRRSRRPAAPTRPDPNEAVFSANVFRNKMAFGLGGNQATVDAWRYLEEPVDRTARELDFERTQMAAVAHACDVARRDRRALDARADDFVGLGPRQSGGQESQGEENWGARHFHPIHRFREMPLGVEKILLARVLARRRAYVELRRATKQLG
jgi:hypothetical protein